MAMDIGQFAFQVGRAGGGSRQALEDEMKRRSFTRQLEKLGTDNPGALDGLFGGAAPGSGRRTPGPGGPMGGGNGGVIPGPGDAMQEDIGERMRLIREERLRRTAGETGGAAGGAGAWADGSAAPSGIMRAMESQRNEQRMADADVMIGQEQAAKAREMQMAYGDGGAYGRGITDPGGKAPAPVVPAQAPADPKLAALKAKLEDRVAGLEKVGERTPQMEAELATKKNELMRMGAPAQAQPVALPKPGNVIGDGMQKIIGSAIDDPSYGGNIMNSPLMDAIAAKQGIPNQNVYGSKRTGVKGLEAAAPPQAAGVGPGGLGLAATGLATVPSGGTAAASGEAPAVRPQQPGESDVAYKDYLIKNRRAAAAAGGGAGGRGATGGSGSWSSGSPSGGGSVGSNSQ